MTTRVETPEGMLRAGAILTRAGPITYTRGELGLTGDPTELVIVNRTLETLAHPDTLASLRGAPITLGHPPDGVTPDNFKAVVVGAVAGEPRVAGDVIMGDLLIGDKDALRRLDAGIDELSIGYSFMIGRNNDTIGPLLSNHLALVPKGRAGSSVRVLDSLEADEMDKKEMMDAIAEAMDQGMKKYRPGMDGGAAFDMEGMKKSFMDTIEPMLDAIREVKDAQDKAITAADEAKAAADAKAVADALVAATRAEERERFAVLTDATPFLSEDKKAGLTDAEPKAILVAALGDSIPDAESKSVDFLRGALLVAKTTAAAAQPKGLPAGVVAYDAARQVTATDARAKAQEDYEAMIAKRYFDSGGR